MSAATMPHHRAVASAPLSPPPRRTLSPPPRGEGSGVEGAGQDLILPQYTRRRWHDGERPPILVAAGPTPPTPTPPHKGEGRLTTVAAYSRDSRSASVGGAVQ